MGLAEISKQVAESVSDFSARMIGVRRRKIAFSFIAASQAEELRLCKSNSCPNQGLKLSSRNRM